MNVFAAFLFGVVAIVALVECRHLSQRHYSLQKMEDEKPADGNDDELAPLGSGAQPDFGSILGSIFKGVFNGLCAPICERYKACRLASFQHPDQFSASSCDFDPLKFPCSCNFHFNWNPKTGKYDITGGHPGQYIPITYPKGMGSPAAASSSSKRENEEEDLADEEEEEEAREDDTSGDTLEPVEEIES